MSITEIAALVTPMIVSLGTAIGVLLNVKTKANQLKDSTDKKSSTLKNELSTTNSNVSSLEKRVAELEKAEINLNETTERSDEKVQEELPITIEF